MLSDINLVILMGANTINFTSYLMRRARTDSYWVIFH